MARCLAASATWLYSFVRVSAVHLHIEHQGDLLRAPYLHRVDQNWKTRYEMRSRSRSMGPSSLLWVGLVAVALTPVGTMFAAPVIPGDLDGPDASALFINARLVERVASEPESCPVATGRQGRSRSHRLMDAWWSGVLGRRIGGSAAGYAWVVMRDGEVLSEGGVGAARVGSTGGSRARMLPTTRMQIASLSKPITAMALVLALSERGLDPDTPMVSLLPAVPAEVGEHVDAITVRDLLTHRSGYPFGYIHSPRAENTHKLLRQAVPSPPGDTFFYSNINYSLARTVLEAVTSEAYPTFVTDRLLLRAGVCGASLAPVPSDAFAHRFAMSPDGARLDIDFTDEGGAYGWYMTARDLASWGDALVRGALMPRTEVEGALGAGLGWNRINTPAGTAFRHDGQWVIPGNLGVRTSMVIWPDGTVAVLFVNTNTPFSPGQVLIDGLSSLTPTFAQVVDRSTGSVIVHVNVPPSARHVRWSSDGSSPTPRSSRYTGPIEVEGPATIQVVGMRGSQVMTLLGVLEISPDE